MPTARRLRATLKLRRTCKAESGMLKAKVFNHFESAVSRQNSNMASILSHAAAGAALSIAFAPKSASARFWPVAIAIAVLPDGDSLLYYFKVSYTPALGHRGFFHSPFLGLILSLLLMLLFSRDGPVFSGRWFRYFFVFFLAWASHGVLDALTTGGYGVAFLSPFSSKRYFFPWTPIQVSPMRIKSFFTPRGWSVFKNELVWIWLPGLMLVFLSRLIRPWMKHERDGITKEGSP